MASSSASGSAMSTPPREEFVIRVPEVLPDQMVSVFKFGANMRVDVTQWNQVTMDREDNADVYAEEDAMPRYGAGSEFGRQARMEARRKKLGYRDRQYRRSDQPWLLTQNDRPTVRKFRGIREGGVSEHADYWLFVKSGDNVFNAYPVNEWYNFMAVSRYKTLDIDEAEEQFKMRTKVLNQFALKSQLKAAAAAAAADSAAEEPSGSADAADGRSDNTTEAIRKAVMKKRKEERKMARKRGSDQDLIASEESDDGDEEGREIDYMSDTESDESESDPGKRETPQLIGVDEEVGMRNFIASDNEEEEEETEGDMRKDLNNMDTYPTTATFGGDEEQDSDSDSDSDDPDSDAIKSAFLLQKKKEGVTTGPAPEAAPKRPAKDEGAQEASSSSLPPPVEKKAKMEVDIREEITEAEVLRYLQRKPLTCQDLVSKFRSRCSRMPKQQVVQRMAHILRKLKPVQVRRNNALYFSLPGRRN